MHKITVFKHILTPIMCFLCSRTMSNKATLALLIYGIIMHYSVNCSPVGLSFPSVRYVHSYLPFQCHFPCACSFFSKKISCISALSSSRAQAEERVCLTVSYICGCNSRLDNWITPSDSQSIELLTQK